MGLTEHNTYFDDQGIEGFEEAISWMFPNLETKHVSTASLYYFEAKKLLKK